MRISIITICFNSIETIKDTLNSVWEQDFEDKELILVDGGSLDGTLEYLLSNQYRINKLVSEADHGIYDAMNKGLSLATGDIIGIINSDDFLANNQILSLVNKFLKSNPNIHGCYGDVSIVKNDKNNNFKHLRIWKPGPFSKKKFRRGWMFPHPALFLRHKVYTDFGNFRLDLGTAADYEFMLRCFYFNELSAFYIPTKFVIMRSGGQSSSSIKNRLIANAFDAKAWRVNGRETPRFLRLFKPTSKLWQWVLASFLNLKTIPLNLVFQKKPKL